MHHHFLKMLKYLPVNLCDFVQSLHVYYKVFIAVSTRMSYLQGHRHATLGFIILNSYIRLDPLTFNCKTLWLNSTSSVRRAQNQEASKLNALREPVFRIGAKDFCTHLFSVWSLHIALLLTWKLVWKEEKKEPANLLLIWSPISLSRLLTPGCEGDWKWAVLFPRPLLPVLN